MSIQSSKRPVTRASWHHGPAWLWLLSFVICIAGDALLGRWVLLPIYVAGFYGGSRNTDWGGLMAASTLTAIPVIVFFLLVQRRIMFGLTAGAVRG